MKKFLLVVSLSLVALMFFSCAKKEEAVEVVDTKSGGVLVFAHSGDAVGLDPARETDGESFMIADNIYNCLVEFEP
ncbi:MAG: ABC transporter substrate-binding protein, partial [Spirochaetota bacterium]|nr:ABC transporter substrate-binding protein [Spirochaetota bacterium]